MVGINRLVGAAQKGSGNSAIRIVTDDVQIQYAKAATEKSDKENVAETEDASVQISEEARQKYMEMQMLKQNAENLREQREAGEKYAEDMAKIMEIFRRIANGDKVPPTDERKLMEYSSEMYQAAKSAAILAENEKRKEYKALFEEEDEPGKVPEAMEANSSTNTSESNQATFENVGIVVS